MDGATGTLYEGEKFQLLFKFSSKYPFDSPEVRLRRQAAIAWKADSDVGIHLLRPRALYDSTFSRSYVILYRSYTSPPSPHCSFGQLFQK